MTADKPSEQAATPEDETKRRFREALDAKKARPGETHLDGGSHPRQPHGPVDAKRVFRRKSG